VRSWRALGVVDLPWHGSLAQVRNDSKNQNLYFLFELEIENEKYRNIGFPNILGNP
jgi:hypothetical protein